MPAANVSTAFVRDKLNARHAHGRPSNNLADAGVLVHVLDGGISPGHPWIGGARGFLSASLLNARKRPHGLYTGGPAVVISPLSKLLCAYPQVRTCIATSFASRHPWRS